MPTPFAAACRFPFGRKQSPVRHGRPHRRPARFQAAAERLEQRLVLSAVAVSDAAATEGHESPAFLGTFVEPNATLGHSADLVFGSDGDLYVVGRSNGRVVRYDGQTGALLGEFVVGGSTGLHEANYLTFGLDGNLYVSGRTTVDAVDHYRVLRFDGATGAYLGDLVDSTGADGLDGIRSPVFGPDGNLYLSSTRSDEILRYDGATGDPLGPFVAAGSGGLDGPGAIRFRDGLMYVASSNTNEVLRFDDRTGAFVDVFASAGGEGLPNDINDLEFGSDGNLYVASQSHRNVLRFDGETGAFMDVYAPAGSGGLGDEGGVLFIASGPDGRLYASNGVRGDILRFGVQSQAVFTVRLSGPSTEIVTVDWATADGTAKAGLDYVAASGTLTFQPGETEHTVLVKTLNDSLAEGSEGFALNLTEVTGATVFDGQGRATVTDDDLAPTISVSDAAATEPKFLGVFADANPAMARPRDLVFGPGGHLYVLGRDSNNVLRFDGATGAYMGEFVPAGSGGLNAPSYLTLGPNEDLYVVSGSNSVLRYDGETGAFVGVFVTPASGGLDGARGPIFGPDGKLYVSAANSNDQVLRYQADGTFDRVFVAAGSGGLDEPGAIRFRKGFVYVTSSITNQVLRYKADGTFDGVFVTAGSGGLDRPNDMEFGPDGHLYVVGITNDSVFRYDGTSGAFIDRYAPAGTGELEADGPFITFGPDGRLYVTNDNAGTVLRFGATEATFRVALSAPSGQSVTVNWSTADGTAKAGADYLAASGTLTFLAGETEKFVTIRIVNDTVQEAPEGFTLILSTAVNATLADAQGAATVTDDDATGPLKFLVVDDGATGRTYRYAADGDCFSATAAAPAAPRDVAGNAAGTRYWVLDATGIVTVYDGSGNRLGSWTAKDGSNKALSDPQGIATNGIDLWIAAAGSDRVYRFSGAGARLSGSAKASSNFALAASSGNKNAKGITTDGTSFWVVDDGVTSDKVFKYSLSSAYQGSWMIAYGGSHLNNFSPTGITVDYGVLGRLWIVDNALDTVFRFDDATAVTSGSQIEDGAFALGPGNTNPQGIADPPELTGTASAVAGTATGGRTVTTDGAAIALDDGVPVTDGGRTGIAAPARRGGGASEPPVAASALGPTRPRATALNGRPGSGGAAEDAGRSAVAAAAAAAADPGDAISAVLGDVLDELLAA